MTNLKEQLEKLKEGQSPEQQAETTRTFNEVYAPPVEPPKTGADVGAMSPAEYREYVRKTYGYFPEA